MKFTLEILLGHADMQSAQNIADALKREAIKLDQYYPVGELPGILLTHVIRDASENVVGHWEVKA